MGVVGGERVGDSPDQAEPVRVGRLGSMVGITAGDSSNCARNVSGAIFCWGANGTGQLGTGRCTAAEPLPVEVDLR